MDFLSLYYAFCHRTSNFLIIICFSELTKFSFARLLKIRSHSWLCLFRKSINRPRYYWQYSINFPLESHNLLLPLCRIFWTLLKHKMRERIVSLSLLKLLLTFKVNSCEYLLLLLCYPLQNTSEHIFRTCWSYHF
jgi:hypothetical protein